MLEPFKLYIIQSDVLRLSVLILILLASVMVNAKDFAMNDEKWADDDDDSDSYSPLGRTKLDEVQGRIISRLYGMGRKPTTIALSFRKPGQESRYIFPRLNTKEAKRAKCRIIVQGKTDISKEIEKRGTLLHEVSTQHIANDADQTQKMKNTHPSDAIDSLRTQPKATLEVDEKRRDENEISLTPSCQRPFDRISLRRASVSLRNEFETSQMRITLSTSTLENNNTLQVPGRSGGSSYDSLRKQLNMVGSKSLLLGCDCRSQADSERRMVSDASSLFPKPRLDSLLNTQGDVQKFRQMIREATEEEERINYCDKLTTQRVELWLMAVRRARIREGLCRQTIDESIESEKHLRQIEDDEEPS